MKSILFVINPRSGVDRVKAIQQLIEKHLDHNQFSYQIAYTQYAHHGTEIAHTAVSSGVDIVVAVGGDGSVNDIAAALVNTRATLAIIPKGSGNGLARSLNIPLDTAKAINLINKQKCVAIDTGKANDFVFTSNAGVGFDALVAKKFAKSKRRGIAAYSWIVTKYLWQYKSRKWQLNIDGKSFTEHAFILTVANAKQFGYNFNIAPVADLQDGIFDIVIIRKFPKILGMLIAFRAFTNTILNSKYVKHYRGSKVSIHHPELDTLQFDGEVRPCSNDIFIALQPHSLKVLIP